MTAATPAAEESVAATPRQARVLPRSDEHLARLVRSCGEQPFRVLYERYQQQLYRYCYSFVRNEPDAQDALQSTFTRALVALRAGRRSAPVRPWLYRIAHNEAISILRARRPAVPQGDPEFATAGPSAEERFSERAELRLLLSDLAQLGERARAALVMRELGGLSHEEISSALEISPGAAKQAIFEGRSALFEQAEGRAMACDEVRRKLSDGDGRVLRGRQVRAHLRDCGPCVAFAAAMPERSMALRALTPTLPAAVVGAVLARAMRGAAAGGHAAAGGSAASGGSALAGTGTTAGAGAGSPAASTAKLLAAIGTPKTLFATAVLAGAAAAGGLMAASPSHHAVRAAMSPPRSAAHGRADHATSASAQRRSIATRKQGSRRSPGAGPRATRSHAVNPGHAANPPGHSAPHGPPPWALGAIKHRSSTPGRSPGHSGAARSRTGIPPGLARHNHTPPGQAKKR